MLQSTNRPNMGKAYLYIEREKRKTGEHTETDRHTDRQTDRQTQRDIRG